MRLENQSPNIFVRLDSTKLQLANESKGCWKLRGQDR